MAGRWGGRKDRWTQPETDAASEVAGRDKGSHRASRQSAGRVRQRGGVGGGEEGAPSGENQAREGGPGCGQLKDAHGLIPVMADVTGPKGCPVKHDFWMCL